GVGGLSGGGAKTTTTVSRTTEAYIASGAHIMTGTSPVNVNAETAQSLAQGNIVGVNIGAIAVTALVNDATVSGSTLAHVDHNARIDAGVVMVTATATQNHATLTTTGVGVG